MNERIFKLAEQANAQYCDLGDASCFKRLGLVEAVVFTPEDLKKFAELIVWECLDIAQDRAAFDGFPPNDVNDIIDEIKEHFGVE